MLDEREPAASNSLLDRRFFQVTKIVFFVRIFRGTDNHTQKRFDAHGAVSRGITTLIPDNLPGQVTLPGLVRLVINQVGQVNIVTVPIQLIALGDPTPESLVNVRSMASESLPLANE